MPADPKPLRVALDASLWDEPSTGIGLYTHRLAAALVEEGVQVTRVGARRSGELPRGATSSSLFFLGPAAGLLAADASPVFHAVCNFNLPLRRIPDRRDETPIAVIRGTAPDRWRPPRRSRNRRSI